MNNLIEVYPCGTIVSLKNHKLTGEIITIHIFFDNITYSVCYFIEGTETIITVHEKQFTTNAIKVPLGFRYD